MRWCREFEAYEVVDHVNTFFDYDHTIGRLRWTHSRKTWEMLPSPLKRNAHMGQIAGSHPKGRDYQIKIDGAVRSAIRLVWEHQTGIKLDRIMTIEPGETRFSIDNLCIIPDGMLRAPGNRAQGRSVVSWSYVYKKFTVVKVDMYYKREILSYHDDIYSATEALSNPVVSFL